MTDSDQVREFFRKMAQGLPLTESSDLLHARKDRLARPAQRSQAPVRFDLLQGQQDFGVGLPPLAYCDR